MNTFLVKIIPYSRLKRGNHTLFQTKTARKPYPYSLYIGVLVVQSVLGHPVQVDTSWSQVICCYKNALTNDMREIYGFLWLASWPPFASPHASSGFANLRWLVSTCVDLQVHLARALCCHSLETKMEANLLFGSFCSVSWSCQCVML